jgi:hypothetical protein
MHEEVPLRGHEPLSHFLGRRERRSLPPTHLPAGPAGLSPPRRGSEGLSSPSDRDRSRPADVDLHFINHA